VVGKTFKKKRGKKWFKQIDGGLGGQEKPNGTRKERHSSIVKIPKPFKQWNMASDLTAFLGQRMDQVGERTNKRGRCVWGDTGKRS